MAERERLIGPSSAVLEGGDGLRFELQVADGSSQPAFAVRYQGKVQAYLNRCAHISVELDWNPGKFFDDSGIYLICATHGALYAPESGVCQAGPCRGAALIPVNILERDGSIYLIETL